MAKKAHAKNSVICSLPMPGILQKVADAVVVVAVSSSSLELMELESSAVEDVLLLLLLDVDCVQPDDCVLISAGTVMDDDEGDADHVRVRGLLVVIVVVVVFSSFFSFFSNHCKKNWVNTVDNGTPCRTAWCCNRCKMRNKSKCRSVALG